MDIDGEETTMLTGGQIMDGDIHSNMNLNTYLLPYCSPTQDSYGLMKTSCEQMKSHGKPSFAQLNLIGFMVIWSNMTATISTRWFFWRTIHPPQNKSLHITNHISRRNDKALIGSGFSGFWKILFWCQSSDHLSSCIRDWTVSCIENIRALLEIITNHVRRWASEWAYDDIIRQYKYCLVRKGNSKMGICTFLHNRKTIGERDKNQT